MKSVELRLFVLLISCRLATSLQLVIGGEQVEISAVPYQVSVQKFGRHACGGALISSNFVFSAAHCSRNVRRVRVGSSHCATGGKLIEVETIFNHPNFSFRNFDYDFAILKLEYKVGFTSYIDKVALPSSKAEVKSGQTAFVSGWGETHSNVNEYLLRGVSLPVISTTDCRNYYQDKRITDRMICAGLAEGGKDSCQGDSGGPLVVDKVLIGIVSWGFKCGQKNAPGVYAKVSSVRDWVTEVTGL